MKKKTKTLKSKIFIHTLMFVFSLVAFINISCSDSTLPTPTPNPYLISGTLTYSGSLGSVNNSHFLVAELNTSATFGHGSLWQQNAVNGANYQMGTSGPGVFNLMAFYRSASPPCDPVLVNGFPLPHQGDPYFVYDGSSCGVSIPITVTAPGTLPINVSFGDSCRFNGVSGSVTYTGSSSVSNLKGIVVALYTDAAYTTLDSTAQEYLTCNQTPFSLGTLSGTTEYLQVFLDLAGTRSPKTGDPYIQYGAVTPSTALTVNLTFNDSTKF